MGRGSSGEARPAEQGCSNRTKNLRIYKSIGQRFILIFVDVLLLVGALLSALWVRFEAAEFTPALHHYVFDHPLTMALTLILFIGLLSSVRLYRYAWRYAGIHVAYAVVTSTTAGTLGMVGIQLLFSKEVLPRSVLLMFWVMSTAAIGGLRVLLRWLVSDMITIPTIKNRSDVTTHRRKVLIAGSIEASQRLIRAMGDERGLSHYEIVGLLDDRPENTGLYYGNTRVLGTLEKLIEIVERMNVEEVIFILPENHDGSEIREYVLECRKRKIPVKVVPNLVESLTKAQHIRLADVQVEDFLHRPMQSLDIDLFGNYLSGKRVLVTGAGGSIGSEICRQIMKLNPAELILLGHGENSIFAIQQELKATYGERASTVLAVISSVTNAQRIDGLFRRFKPEIVFHAAAHKHLPLMEENICEAVHNNVIGTYNVVSACAKYEVSQMVQISTDKAADPTSIMGATKRLCEMVVRAVASKYPKTSFVCVRFGNVLGSRGSVIPVFHEQIRNGGPVTVTHPEMTRYFMTIPEAVRLVIQTGAVGKSGDTYLLDMGYPVKILDLAEDMIRLHGLEPNVDIPIVFTGIRPGEKLHEQLASNTESVEHSGFEGVSRVRSDQEMSFDEATCLIADCKNLVEALDGGGVVDLFDRVISGFAKSSRARFAKPAT